MQNRAASWIRLGLLLSWSHHYGFYIFVHKQEVWRSHPLGAVNIHKKGSALPGDLLGHLGWNLVMGQVSYIGSARIWGFWDSFYTLIIHFTKKRTLLIHYILKLYICYILMCILSQLLAFLLCGSRLYNNFVSEMWSFHLSKFKYKRLLYAVNSSGTMLG